MYFFNPSISFSHVTYQNVYVNKMAQVTWIHETVPKLTSKSPYKC